MKATDRTFRAMGAMCLLALLGGCATGSGGGDADGTDQAREVLLELLRTPAMSSYTRDLDGFARAASAHAGVGATRPGSPTDVELIGITADAAEDHLGTLTFAVRLPAPVDDGEMDLGVPDPPDPGPYCFDVEFDHHGKVGEWGAADGTSPVDCPPTPSPVTPPPSTDPVVAANAREAATAVLRRLPAGGVPSAEQIAAQVTAELAPADGPAPLAAVTAAVDGADVGIATGGPDDCVLVARVDGEVRDVVVAPVQLQPGESGCTATTALHPPDPPH